MLEERRYEEIAAVDRGLPEDLRLNPDVEHARAVASTETATLYAASLRDGGRCSELVTAGDRGRGATCSTAADESARPIDLAIPFDDDAGAEAAVVLAGRLNDPAGAELEISYEDGGSNAIAGRLNDPAGAELEISYEDGGSNAIPLGDDRYFAFEVPAEHLAAAHESGFRLVARDQDGSIVASSSVPGDWDDKAVPDEEAPLYVGTRSDESDLTKVYGLEGHVGAPGAVSLELDYGDGERVQIAIKPDRSFEYTVPEDRVDDFMTPRTVVARDDSGEVVASRTVAAVAYWRGRERRP